MARDYKHSELKKNKIRLLQLSKKLPLRGKIVHYSQHKAPPYTAISYCWGNEPATINIGRKTLLITKNLYDALSQLRSAGTVIWADAICLNQADDAEKSREVARMSEVYRGAAQTFVWLGAENLDLRVFTRLKSLLLTYIDEADLRQGRLNGPIFTREDLDLTVAEEDTAIQLYSSPWFTRVWVLQEAAVSENCIIAHGNSTMSWSTLAIVTGGFNHSDFSLDIVGPERRPTRLPESIERLRDSGSRWFSVISATTFLACTDVRDHWFGIRDLIPVQSPQLEPDYSKAIKDTFIDVATVFVLRGTMWILGFARQDSGLPTWVCDLSQPYRGTYCCNEYDAGGWCYTDIEVIGKDLFLPMYILDTITETVDAWNDAKHDWYEEALDLQRVLKGAQDLTQGPYITGEDPKKAFLRTLICDSKTTDRRCDDEDLKKVDVFLEAWTTAADPSKLDLYQNGEKDVYTGFNLHSHRVQETAFIKSERGFMGWGPPETRPGDKICTVLNAQVPYIFRETDSSGTMTLIGPAYVHGVMYGMIDDQGNVYEEVKHLIPTERVRMRII